MNSLMQQSLNTFEAEDESRKRDFINLQKTVAEKGCEVIRNVPYDGNFLSSHRNADREVQHIVLE